MAAEMSAAISFEVAMQLPLMPEEIVSARREPNDMSQ
jgi:hypothetical protein